LPVRKSDARAGRHCVAELLRWCGFIPSFQFEAGGRNEAQHCAGIQAADEDELESLPGWFDNNCVGVRVASHVFHAMEQRQHFNPIMATPADTR